MKGWLQPLGVIGLLAAAVAANEVELVRLLLVIKGLFADALISRSKTTPTGNDAPECTAENRGEEPWIPSY